MNDLISRQSVYDALHSLGGCDAGDEWSKGWDKAIDTAISELNEIPTACDVEYELRLLKNYINEMPKVYRKRNMNWVIVRDLLMQGTSTSGRTSCITKCYELGTDPWGYELKGAVKDE